MSMGNLRGATPVVTPACNKPKGSLPVLILILNLVSTLGCRSVEDSLDKLGAIPGYNHGVHEVPFLAMVGLPEWCNYLKTLTSS